MSHQININKETKIITENQVEIMDLKYITKMKNSLEGLNSWQKKESANLNTCQLEKLNKICKHKDHQPT